MKICIIHSSQRRGNTYRATEIFKEELRKLGNVTFTEFFLPKDMPHFCVGCYSCFDKGADKCPHSNYTQPIEAAIREADGLVFSSPVYVLGESAQMKALLDHFGYMFIPHRPMEDMFSKVAVVISTTAGAGTKHSIGCISRSLKYWGISKVYKCGFNIFAKDWKDMKIEKQQKFHNILAKRAKQFYAKVSKGKSLKPSIFAKLLFSIMRKMQNSYEDGHPDKEYWRAKGWLAGMKPW